MKHSINITILLLLIFLAAQFIGIAIIHQYIDPIKSQETGKTEFQQLPIGERPEMAEETSFLPIMIAIIIGTIFLLLLIKYQLIFIWKLWFLIAVIMSLTVALAVFISKEIALILAIIFGLWKIFKPNFWIQNLTEIFVYGGLAVIFVPVFNLLSVSILLILISIYDVYAVWKSKHMITLAKSQMSAKVFAGILIPYKPIKSLTEKKLSGAAKKVKARMAVLGGGDIGFPLIFAGVVMTEFGLWQSLIIPIFALLGLAALLFTAKEKKFYPAMPFISAGCFLGLGVVWLMGLL